MPQSTRAEGAKAAHNNVFQVLGEHGFLGLAIYLSILALAFKNLAAVIVRTRHIPELQWARRLAIACGISFVAYNVAGLTVSLPYYDFALILIVQIACLRRLVAKTISERGRNPAASHFSPVAGTPSLAIGAAMRSHGTSRDSA
jgi:putative inorganic carbon (hco3(-)) transporter